MKIISLFVILFFLISFSACAQSGEKRILTAADYEKATKYLSFNTGKLVDRSNVKPNWLPDGSFWYSINSGSDKKYVLVNSADGSRKTAPSLNSLVPDAHAETAMGNRRNILPEVSSPDKKKTAFIRNWNLWVRDAETKKETQLTTDGIKDYGYATDNAGWKKSDSPVLLWSPDSKKIATFRQDQRHVSDMYLVSTTAGSPKLSSWKYPNPTDSDIIRIQRVIIEVDNAKLVQLNIPADARRGTLCDDIACSGSFDDNEWNADATRLAFVSTTRDHKEEKMRIANALTGEVKEIFEEKVATQYESGQGKINWHWLSASNEFIWYSEREDWGHLYLYDAETGKLKNQITKGEFVVTQLLKVDEKNRLLFFIANGKEKGRDPYFSHFYRVDFNGKHLMLLTPEDANHEISLSPDGKYFTDSYSKPDMPPDAVLRDLDGKLIIELEKTDISRLQATGWKAPETIKVRSHNGKWDLYGLMFAPTNLDKSKKYPVVNYIYPGPQGGGVGSRSFSASRSDHQALAELGFVVVVIDGTCNPGMSKSFHDLCYGNMADNTLDDQVAGLKELAISHPYMDLGRVGIWGHSGGGYAAASAMFRFPDFYKVGIAESGNHDNRNYEDDWGERYIGLMSKNTNGKSNYEEQANQNFASKLKGKLMLAHGAMDDNVPPYNTYLVVNALIKANKDFDLLIFPQARHGYGSDSFYMMRRRWDYFVRYLMGAEPPEGFRINGE